MTAPYSISRMRSSLYAFAAGKIVSGAIGVVWLVGIVRMLAVSDYAAYITLIALLEITLLVSNAGVYPFAQRYITEARLPQNLDQLPRLVWQSIAYRVVTLAVAGAVLSVFASPLANWLGQPLVALGLALYIFVIAFEGTARYIELVFESLLEQGWAQLTAVIRNGMRLALVYYVWATQGEVALIALVQLEATTTGLGLALGLIAMRIALARYPHAEPATEKPTTFGLGRVWRFSAPLYLAQCLTQVYSPDTVKLFVSRVLGATEVAVFGFAHSFSYFLQRYLPASLLIGLIRPMLVARKAASGSDDDLFLAGNLILKINLFLLLPVAALFAVQGREFSQLVSGGKYEDAGPLLFMLTLLLVLQGLHVVLSVLATAIENRSAVLGGTLVSMPGVLIGLLLAERMGAPAMAAGLWVSEAAWCAFTLYLLRRSGFRFTPDWQSWARLGAAALAAGLLAALFGHSVAPAGWLGLCLCALVIGTGYLLGCWLLRPLSNAEVALVARMLPGPLRRLAGIS